MALCTDCGLEWPEDRFNRDCVNPDTCFKCRAAGIGVTYGYRGRQNFHATTIKESNDITLRDARANGFDPVPVSTKASHGGAHMTKLKAALGG